MEIAQRSQGDFDILQVMGHVNSADVRTIETELQHLYDLGRCQVILDLSACTYIGSAGLSLLVRFANSFRRWDRGDLYLAGVSPYIQGLLGIAGLATDESQFFRQYTSVEAALGSLPGDGRDDVR